MENNGSDAAGNPTPDDAAAGGAPAAGGDQPWYGSVQNAELRGWAENKGFKTPEAALDSYRNLEKMFGADKAGRTVVLPGENAEPQEREDFFNKLGRPESPDKYEIATPDDADTEFVDWFKMTAHKHGLTASQAKAFAEEYNGFVENRMTADTDRQSADITASMEALDKEWGQAKPAKLHAAKSAAAEFGVTKEQIDAMESAMGYGSVMKLFAAIGERVGETPGLANGGDTNFSSMTPEAAKQRLADLQSDQAWMKMYMNGSKTHFDQFDRLQRIAHGGS